MALLVRKDQTLKKLSLVVRILTKEVPSHELVQKVSEETLYLQVHSHG